jgi:hypothetical protein
MTTIDGVFRGVCEELQEGTVERIEGVQGSTKEFQWSVQLEENELL